MTDSSMSEWLSQRVDLNPPSTDRVQKYFALGIEPKAIFDRMQVIGEHKNKLNREALHILLRACHSPNDIEVPSILISFVSFLTIDMVLSLTLLLIADSACCFVTLSTKRN